MGIEKWGETLAIQKNAPKVSLTFLESDVSHTNSSSLHNILIVYLYGGIVLPKSVGALSNNNDHYLPYCKSVWNLPYSDIQMISLCSFSHHNRQENLLVSLIL